ncbi:hypothetical protein FQZ97_1014320 [compost metagenome]
MSLPPPRFKPTSMASITRAGSVVPMRKRSATTSSTLMASMGAALALPLVLALSSTAGAARCTTRSACTRV